jgi:hypothetical protein
VNHVAVQRRAEIRGPGRGARVKIKIEKNFAPQLPLRGVDKDGIGTGNFVAGLAHAKGHCGRALLLDTGNTPASLGGKIATENRLP